MVTGFGIQYIERYNAEKKQNEVINIRIMQVTYPKMTKGYQLKLAQKDSKGRPRFVAEADLEGLLEQYGLEAVDPKETVKEEVIEALEDKADSPAFTQTFEEVKEEVEAPKKKRKRRTKAEMKADEEAKLEE